MRYGELQYGSDAGVFLYGDSEVNKQRDEELEGYTDLEKYVPGFITDINEFHEWYQAQGYEVGREWAYLRNIYAQLYAQTVNTYWGLALWERLLGITASEEQTTDNRRQQIIAKLRTTQTCTPALLKKLTKDLTGVECRIVEDFEHYKFTIQFVGQYGVVKNSMVLSRQVEEIKPAHLLFELEYRYVIWNELAQYTWNDLSAYTWDGLRIWGHISRVTWHGIANASLTWRTLRLQNWTTIKNLEEAKE